MNKKSYSLLELSLKQGFDLNIPWSDHLSTPLAYILDNERMARWFLDHGADPNAESRIDRTPLSRAVIIGSFDMIKLLFERGGPESITHGQLLHYATSRNLPDQIHVIEYLFTKGATRDINKLQHQDRLSLFEEENLIIGCKTPLHLAAGKGKLEVVKLLVAHGADPVMKDGKGRLAIEEAQESHHTDVVDYLLDFAFHA